MNKIYLALATFAFLITASNALYRHQVGKFDWDIKTIGDIERVRFLAQRTAFITKDGFIGAFVTNNGQVDWSKDLSASSSHAEFGNNGFLVLEPESRTVSIYEYNNGLKLTTIKLESISSQEQIIDVSLGALTDQSILTGVLTKENIYLYKDEKLSAKHAVKTPLQYLRFNKDKNVAYGVSDDNKEVCLHSFGLSSQTQSAKKCFKKAASGSSTVNVNSNGVVIRSPQNIRLISFSNEQELSYNLTSTQKATYLQKCDVVVVSSDNGNKVLSINTNKGSFDQIASVDGHFDKTFFDCNEESDGKYLISIQTNGASTIKITSLNLQSPSAPAKILFDKIVDFNLGKPEEVYSDRLGGDFKLIVKTSNLQIVMISKENKILWKHEDSLSEIKETQFFDYQSLEANDINPYFEHLDTHQDSLVDVPVNLIRRLKAQSERFIKWTDQLVRLASVISKSSFKELLETDSNFDKQNGLQKIIIATTGRNTIFGIDSKTGVIFWEKIIEDNWRIEKLYKSKVHHSVKEALIYLKDVKSNQGKLLHVNPLDGITTSSEILEKIPQEIIQLQLARSTAFLIVFDEKNVQLYPKEADQRAVLEQLKDLSVYKINKKEIVGYRFFGTSLTATWNFNLQPHEEILATSQWSYDTDETAFKTIIPEDQKVIYKFSDSNNFALLTKSTIDKPHLNLYVLNGVTGRVLSSKSQFDVDFSQPINLLYDENSVFVSYYNTIKLNYEIWVTELYKSQLESSFTHLLERYFFEKINVDEEERYHNADAGFVVFTQKYHFPPGIKSLGVVETIHGISRKNVIIVTSNGQVYSLDRGLLSTRRQIAIEGKPLESDANSFGSAELPPYSPLLPINYLKYLTYYKRFTGLKHIEASPTRFESTSLVLLYGHDVVYVRTAPEKEFDMLSSDFKYEILIGSIIIVAVALVVIKRLTKKHKVQKLFLGS